MILKIELNPGAEEEFDDAADWYGSDGEDVKAMFIEAINSTLARIQRSPSAYPIVYGTETRKAVVRKFPFVVLFVIQPNRILVYAIFHTSRNPIKWQGRID